MTIQEAAQKFIFENNITPPGRQFSATCKLIQAVWDSAVSATKEAAELQADQWAMSEYRNGEQYLDIKSFLDNVKPAEDILSLKPTERLSYGEE